MTTQENNEYLVQQQNSVQYRTISKYKTHDKMEKTGENQQHQTNGERVKSGLRMHNQKTYGEYDVRSKHDPCIDATHHAQHRQNMHRARSSDKMYSERSQHAALAYMEINTQQLSAAKLGHFIDAQ